MDQPITARRGETREARQFVPQIRHQNRQTRFHGAMALPQVTAQHDSCWSQVAGSLRPQDKRLHRLSMSPCAASERAIPRRSTSSSVSRWSAKPNISCNRSASWLSSTRARRFAADFPSEPAASNTAPTGRTYESNRPPASPKKALAHRARPHMNQNEIHTPITLSPWPKTIC
jgi:hypothetical protein